VILVVIIVVKLIAGSAPGDQGITADIFDVPSGTSLDTVATAAVFGFLSFAGFEGAASLGEETADPKHRSPRSGR
jgi:amino acid transporter